MIYRISVKSLKIGVEVDNCIQLKYEGNIEFIKISMRYVCRWKIMYLSI